MQELLYGGAAFWLWIIPAALTMFVSRRMFKIPDELFRKILHFILLIAYKLIALENFYKLCKARIEGLCRFAKMLVNSFAEL